MNLPSRLPPIAIDAEQAALAACLVDRRCVRKLVAQVDVEEFFFEAHRSMYRAIVALDDEKLKIDTVTVAERMRVQGTLDAAGGMDYVKNVYGTLQNPALMDSYLAPIQDAAVRRKVIESAQALEGAAYESDAPGVDVAEAGAMTLQAIASSKTRCEGRSARTAFAERRQELKDGISPEIIRLHQPDLDAILKIHPGDLIVVAGILNTGKSATMLNWLMSAVFADIPCELWSLEMMERECLDRMAAAKSGVGATKINEGKLTPDEAEKVDYWMETLEGAKLQIYDKPVANVEALRGELRLNAQKYGSRLVFIDQLRQLNSRGRHENETLRLGHVAQQLKQSARENKNAIILLHQLNRAGDDNGRPEVKHLRQSGMIAEDCDAVVLIYQPDRRKEHARGEYADEVPMEWIIPRQRNGPKGTVKRTFKLSTQRIFEWSDQFDDDDAPVDFHRKDAWA